MTPEQNEQLAEALARKLFLLNEFYNRAMPLGIGPQLRAALTEEIASLAVYLRTLRSLNDE